MRFWFIGDMLEWVLLFIYRFIPNYGLAVIFFTLVIRLLLMPLDVKSKRSMRKTMKLQPQIDALNKKYAKDKEKLQQKTSELYRKEKVSPMAGCLPMLLQMPILFAMYAVMRDLADVESINLILNIQKGLETVGSSYYPDLQSFLWIKNVFQPDSFMSTVVPAANDALATLGRHSITDAMVDQAKAFLASDAYHAWADLHGNATVYTGSILGFWTITIPEKFNGLFILPVMALLSQIVTNKLTGTTQQQQPSSGNESAASTGKIMKYVFPIISVMICATSNAGFALYWVSVNIIQGLQQIIINKVLDYKEKAALEKEGTVRP